jgi:hypothetical protein
MPARQIAAAALAAAIALPAAAQTLTERQARNEVASPRGVDVRVADLPWMTDDVRRRIEQELSNYPYYAALVMSPGNPAGTPAGGAIVNYHSPEAATRAALEACEAQRGSGPECVVVAQVLPRRYEGGRLTLSKAATEALRGDFRQLEAPKALAISPGTGQFAFARGDGSRALSRCNAQAQEAGAQDCRIVVAEP